MNRQMRNFVCVGLLTLLVGLTFPTLSRSASTLPAAEAVARIKGDWKADIAAYDKVHEQILHMADMLSDGIVKQHAAKF